MELNYKGYGNGKPVLVILHGLFGSLDNWHTLATRWGEHFRVLAVDQRNHGRSPHAGEFNYEVMARDLHEFLQQQELQEAVLLGHSMGGKTVMQFAMDFPQYVQGLLVADMAPRDYPPGHDEIIDALRSLDLSQVERRSDANKLLAQKISNWGVRQFLLKNLTRKDDDSYGWKMNLPVIDRNYDRITDRIPLKEPYRGPALFLNGEKSGYIQEDDHEEIREYFPSARFHTFSDTGHWLHAEKPDEMYEVVKEFMQERV